MKIDKDFAVKVDDKIFEADEIMSINIDNARVKIECWNKHGSRFSAEASTKNVEFLNLTQIPKLAHGNICRCIDKDKTPNSYRQYTDHSWSIFDNAIKQIEIDNEVQDSIKQTTREVVKEYMENVEKRMLNCELKLDGKDLAKLIKKYNHTGGD